MIPSPSYGRDAENCQKRNSGHIRFLSLFVTYKEKNHIFSNPYVTSAESHPRNIQTKFQDFCLGGSLKKVHRSNFRTSQFEVFLALLLHSNRDFQRIITGTRGMIFSNIVFSIFLISIRSFRITKFDFLTLGPPPLHCN